MPPTMTWWKDEVDEGDEAGPAGQPFAEGTRRSVGVGEEGGARDVLRRGNYRSPSCTGQCSRGYRTRCPTMAIKGNGSSADADEAASGGGADSRLAVACCHASGNGASGESAGSAKRGNRQRTVFNPAPRGIGPVVRCAVQRGTACPRSLSRDAVPMTLGKSYEFYAVYGFTGFGAPI